MEGSNVSREKVYTTGFGAPVDDDQNSKTAGSPGPVLMQDAHLLEKLGHFNRERIPERVVHAKGAGAHGYFEVTGGRNRVQRRAYQGVPKRVLYRLYPPCIWFPELDIPPSFCRAMSAFEKVATEIVNPKIKTMSSKLMTAGDPYCEIIFEEE